MYTSFLKATDKKTDEYEQDIKNLGLQIDQLMGENEELSLQNAALKEEIGKLDTACANWKDQALRATKELAEAKEADKKLLEILQKRL